MRGSRPSALAISISWRRDSGRSFTRRRGLMSSQPIDASSASVRRIWARTSMRPSRRGASVMQMLSATDRSGISDSSWNTQAMPWRIASRGVWNAVSWPPSARCPVSGRMAPPITLIRVLLPAPFSPRMAWIECVDAAKSTASSASTPPNRFDTPDKARSGVDASNPSRDPALARACNASELMLTGTNLGDQPALSPEEQRAGPRPEGVQPRGGCSPCRVTAAVRLLRTRTAGR